MDAYLSRPWAGVELATAVGSIGVVLLLLRGAFRTLWARRTAHGLGWLAVVVSIPLGASAAIGARHRAALVVRHPAPGKLVDVGGYRIHVLAEGPVKQDDETPTLVWLPGGYGPGLWMAHLHRQFRDQYRSCLFDRAGCGYSDPGPMPRTQDRMAEELHAALLGAGEKGPYILIGHSAGGLQAAHFAHRYPKETAGVVVLDGSSPMHFSVEGRRYWGGRSIHQAAMTLGAVFGVDVLFPWLHPLRAEGARAAAIDPKDWELLVEFEARPSALAASQSLGDSDMKSCFDTVRGRHVLGDIPLLSVVQANRTADPKEIEIVKKLFHLNDEQIRVWQAYRRAVQNEYAEMSRNGRLVEMEPAMNHLFPTEQPDYTTSLLREFLKPWRREPSTSDAPPANSKTSEPRK